MTREEALRAAGLEPRGEPPAGPAWSPAAPVDGASLPLLPFGDRTTPSIRTLPGKGASPGP